MEQGSADANDHLLALGIRNRNDITTGDFVAFELYDGKQWRPSKIGGTALAVLARRNNTPLSSAFEDNAEKIAAAGKRHIAKNPLNGYVVLGADDF